MTKYTCDDGNAEVEIEANSHREAARQYVDDGDWGVIDETTWITVYVEEMPDRARLAESLPPGCVVPDDVDGDGDIIEMSEEDFDAWIPPRGWEASWDDRATLFWRAERREVTITLHPKTPNCQPGKEHDWQSPHELVGGIEENPGVWGNGGGIIAHEVCMHCGCGKVTDTWAQNPETGEQGLTSISYEEGKYADFLAEERT